MWQQLGSVALEEGDISTAERCAAALGDVSRARFLHKVGNSQQRGGWLCTYKAWVFLGVLGCYCTDEIVRRAIREGRDTAVT